jgi:hypothetical protein
MLSVTATTSIGLLPVVMEGCALLCVNSTIQNLVMQCQLSSLGSLFAISCGYSACETFCPEIYAAI